LPTGHIANDAPRPASAESARHREHSKPEPEALGAGQATESCKQRNSSSSAAGALNADRSA